MNHSHTPEQSRTLAVCLVDTSAPGSRGSMARYAHMLERVLTGTVDGVRVSTIRRRLAPAVDTLPGPLSNALHHAAVWWRAGRLKEDAADVFHVLDGSHAYVVDRLPEACTVVTAHDVIPLLQAEGRFDVPPPGGRAMKLIRGSLDGLRRADAIACDSACTRDDLVDAAGLSAETLRVVPLAAPPSRRDTARPWAERRAVDRPLVLHVGSDAFYKNRAGVLNAFARVREQGPARLTLVGPPPSDELDDLIAALGIGGDVAFAHNLTDNELAALYNEACVLLFPSLYEGFGWPPVEAMAHACPVVCSNAASLPEVVGDAALTAGPRDPQALAGQVLRVLGDEAVAHELIRRGFQRVAELSEDAMARGLVALYRAALDRRKDA